MKRKRVRRAMRMGLPASVLLLAGCAQASNLLSPEFLTALGLDSPPASLPGDAPALLVWVENRTGRTISAQVSYRLGNDEVQTVIFTVNAGEKSGESLPCPVSELTLGDIGDLNQTGAIVILGAGGANDPFIEVEPFGTLLKEGVNYDCGDAVTFAVQPSGETRSGFQIFAYIQRAE